MACCLNIYGFFRACSVFHGSSADYPFEITLEAAYVSESAFKRNIKDGIVRFKQKILGMLHSHAVDKRAVIYPERGLNTSRKVLFIVADGGGYLGKWAG